MDLKLVREIGLTTLVGVVVFGWVFSQPPLPQQIKAPKAAKKAAVESQAGKRSDQIPSVPQQTPSEINIKIEPVSLATPDQALQPVEDLVQVTASKLIMRSGPSSSTQLVSIYSRGSTFEKIGQNGNWLHVRSTEDGNSGWMFTDYLQSSN